MMKLRRFSLAAAILLAACGAVHDERHVSAVLKYDGPAVNWRIGDRIRAEGRLARTPDGLYILETSTKNGTDIRSDCLLLRDTGQLGLMSRITKMLLAGTGKLLNVTGQSKERFPTYPLRQPGQHLQRMCIADVVVEELNVGR